MRGMNSVFLVGRAGHDPEIRTSKAGKPWCTLGVATHRNVRGEDGEWVEETDWHDVVLFGDTATEAGKLVARGCKVAVEGALSYDGWTDEHGNKRRSTRILANTVKVVGEPRSEAVMASAEDPRPAESDAEDVSHAA